MITLDDARRIIDGALSFASANGLAPLTVAVLDSRGVLKCLSSQDGISIARPDIAVAKANGALAMGMGGRDLAKAAKNAPHFIQSLTTAIPGGLIPHLGGVLVKNSQGVLVGAVGISGDRGDMDEAAAIEGIKISGLQWDAGNDE